MEEEGKKKGLWLDTHQTPSLTSFPTAILSQPSVSGLLVLYVCTTCMYIIICTWITSYPHKLLVQNTWNSLPMLFHLSEPGDLGQVLKILHDAGLAAKWRAIGQTLTVSDANLAGFDARFSGDPSLCLLQVVASWLHGQKRLPNPPSWWMLVWAVADPQGGGTVHGGKRMAAMLRGVSGCSRVLSLSLIHC